MFQLTDIAVYQCDATLPMGLLATIEYGVRVFGKMSPSLTGLVTHDQCTHAVVLLCTFDL